MRAPREKTFAVSCHLFNTVPIWGLIFCGWVWYALREESRAVVATARQAMAFHAALLAALLVWMIVELVCRLLNVISVPVGQALNLLNDVIMTLFYLFYVGCCLLGCVRALSGQPFRYPLAGARQ